MSDQIFMPNCICKVGTEMLELSKNVLFKTKYQNPDWQLINLFIGERLYIYIYRERVYYKNQRFSFVLLAFFLGTLIRRRES